MLGVRGVRGARGEVGERGLGNEGEIGEFGLEGRGFLYLSLGTRGGRSRAGRLALFVMLQAL